ncbi:MAG TPA: hypothetical protein VH641_07505 [Streptosporangiaceae bacterium]
MTMHRAEVDPTPDQALWVVIRNSAEALSFENYAAFIEPIMCGLPPPRAQGRFDHVSAKRQFPFPDAEPYRLLKVATEVFMMANCGVVIGQTPDNLDSTRATTLEHARFRRLTTDDALADEEQLRLLRSTSASPRVSQQWDEYLKTVGQDKTIPYLDIVRLKLGDLRIQGRRAYGAQACYGILRRKLTRPCLLELLWNYWQEEGMLAQTMNAISWRFQNRRGRGSRDPLAMLEVDPLRGLNNLLWGWVQDEEHRLTIPRRAYEYDHEYGLSLIGRAAPPVQGADSRSRFLEGFHTLLMLCTIFYKEDDDTTVVADGFPALNALREVHLQLTQGAHNQYGDLPWTARLEFLMMQWLLARPEMREFLPRRIMVDYPEGWMDSVESMKSLQGWTDTSILHFRDLAIFGEKLLLSIRYGAWTSQIHPENAANWARYWRPEVQGYIHAYRAATGVDLASMNVSGQVNATMPAVLLSQRLPRQAPADEAQPQLLTGGAPPAVRAASARPAVPDGTPRRALPAGAPRRGRADGARQRKPGDSPQPRMRP